MKEPKSEFDENSEVEIAAAEWIARLDRGLSGKEQDDYVEWLAQDESHRNAVAKYLGDWENFDRLAGIHLKSHARIDPDLLKPDNWKRGKPSLLFRKLTWIAALPIAAVLVVGIVMSFLKEEKAFPSKIEPAYELLTRIEQRTLEDGSMVEINRGSAIEVLYTDSERRINLITGEANFEVVKDPDRPFIVNAAGVDVKAIGTIFNVKLSGVGVDVIVREGKVNLKVHPEFHESAALIQEPVLEIGQKATVKLVPGSTTLEIVNLKEEELSEAIYWQPRLLDYDSITLGELVREFNRSNPIQVEFGDPSLESISLSSSFWSDNVEGFVRLMESSFGMKAKWIGSREIILTRQGI